MNTLNRVSNLSTSLLFLFFFPCEKILNLRFFPLLFSLLVPVFFVRTLLTEFLPSSVLPPCENTVNKGWTARLAPPDEHKRAPRYVAQILYEHVFRWSGIVAPPPPLIQNLSCRFTYTSRRKIHIYDGFLGSRCNLTFGKRDRKRKKKKLGMVGACVAK